MALNRFKLVLLLLFSVSKFSLEFELKLMEINDPKITTLSARCEQGVELATVFAISMGLQK